MKVKSIFVSMLAIAALASCSRQEFVDPPSPQEGSKMLVDITLSNGEKSKAAGVATVDEDKTINNVTVFFLNATDQIVSKTYVPGASLTPTEDGTGKTVSVETRSTATQMMVIANLGEDRTTGTLNVSTKSQLEGVVQSLITSGGSPAPVQVKTDVLMSGEGVVQNMTANPDGGASTANASVTLNFIAAKITLSSIALGNDVKGTYGTDFKFTRAFLLNVQTNSWYFPTTNSYIPTPKAYANGSAWDANWGGS
nr:fimbrial protein [Parabacteroides goldsteinii]